MGKQHFSSYYSKVCMTVTQGTGSLSSFHETSRRILRYGNSFPPTFPEVLLAHASQLTGQLSQACKYDELVRQYKCRAHDNYVRIFSFTTDSCMMTSYCRICAGPIENPPDGHDHCIACLGLAHAEAALEESDCAQCADLPLRVLRTRRNVARGLSGVRPTAANVPLVGPPPPLESGDDNLARSHRSQRSDSMSISASEKEEWVGSERDPSDIQEELIRVMNKAVQELELSWNPPEEPAKSKLDSWYFRSSRRQVDTRTWLPFFPDVHDQLVKTWSAPQSARVHSATQAMFSQVDGAVAHGYVRMPPVEETVAAHLCPASAKTMGSDISLPVTTSRG